MELANHLARLAIDVGWTGQIGSEPGYYDSKGYYIMVLMMQ